MSVLDTLENLIDDLIEQQKQQQKASAICWSVVVWLTSGVYLFSTTPEVNFILLNALLFAAIGALAAGFYGMLFYFARRRISEFLVKIIPFPGRIGISVQLLGIGFFVGQIVLVCLAARECFGHLLAGDFPSFIPIPGSIGATPWSFFVRLRS